MSSPGPTDSLEWALAQIGSASSLLERRRTLFARLSGGMKRAVVVGAGALGRITLSAARAAGVEVVAFADNDRSLWGSTRSALRVLRPADAVDEYGRTAYFVVAIYNGASVQQQLRGLGCETVVPFQAFSWNYEVPGGGPDCAARPESILREVTAVRAAFGSLTDRASRVEFASQVAWRGSLDDRWLPQAHLPGNMYFAPDLFRLHDHEVFVDCGAYDGDSIRTFLDKTSLKFERIVACEPDAHNRAALHRFLATLSPAARARISVLPFALSDHDGVVRFATTGAVDAHIAQSSSDADTVVCRRLDRLLATMPKPTLIKMDIEGAEPAALAGLRGSLPSSRPILAICAYHEADHLWRLPLLLKSLLPEHRLALRRYAEGCWETVYYAVPEERWAEADAA